MLSESSVTLCTLIQDVLDYTQLKTKKLQLSYQTFDLLECVKSSLSMITIEAERKGIKLLKSVSNNVPLCVVTDPKRLKQILVNLLTNAVKFTTHGHILVRIDLDTPKLSSDIFTIKFAVEDTGIGICEKDQSKLFKPFSQIDNENNQGTSTGTGLGLIISRYLANLLGGDITFESQYKKGSTFYLTIRAKACGIDSVKDYYGPILKSKSILVIERDIDSKNRIVRFLLEEGIETISCDTKEMATTYLKSNIYHFDIVVVEEKFISVAQAYHKNLITIVDSSNQNKQHIKPKIIHNIYVDTDRGLKIYRPVDRSQLLQSCYSSMARATHYNIDTSASPFTTQLTKPQEALKIIVAEDDYINRQVIVEILKKLGYLNVVAVENGQEAYEIMKDETFDVLLLDLKMPVLNGYQLFKKIAADFTTEQMPSVIALTASAMNVDKERCINMGMDHYLSKPVQISELKEILANTKRNGTILL